MVGTDALYHGGAPGFAKGELIMPHETKHLDGCPVPDEVLV